MSKRKTYRDTDFEDDNPFPSSHKKEEEEERKNGCTDKHDLHNPSFGESDEDEDEDLDTRFNES